MLSAQQLSLFPDPPPLALDCRDRAPRVWVRRLVLWQEMDSAPFRDIALERGLNIVWSPSGETPEDDRLPSGHAAGKTLFCRALRHCLGEASFAAPDDALKLRRAFPRGAIGAEVVVGEQVWVVRRPLAVGPDLAVRGGDLLAISEAKEASDFMSYLDALQATLGDAARVSRYPEPHAHHPWQYALAWLMRDQECRVDGIANWRHKDTGSRSPVRSSSAEARLTVLRLALDVYDTQASERAERINKLTRSVPAAEAAARRVVGERDALVSALAGGLGIDEAAVCPPEHADDLWEGDFKRRIRELTRARIASLRQPTRAETPHLDDTRLEVIEADFAEMQARLDSKLSEVEALRAERALHAEQRPNLDWRLSEAKHPTCPWDRSPLDVEASKAACPLVRFEDPEPVRREIEKLKHRATEVAELLATLEPQLVAATREHRRLRGERDRRALRVHERLENEAKEQARHDPQMAAAWGASSLAELLLDATQRAKQAHQEHSRLATHLQTLRDEENGSRAAQDVGPVTAWFRALIQRVLGKEASGRVWLDGHGLHAEIDQHSVALNSLRVVLFDLAVMLCAAEAKAFLPALLLHDSPREGDLDPSTYRRIFRAVHALASDPDHAPFQYIITTTSSPPEDMQQTYLRLTLASLPATERFYGVDL